MHFSFLEALVALAALTAASPTPKRATHHVTHEKRHQLPAEWTRRERVEGGAVLPLRIGLQQRNLDRADELLDGVSNPKSASYAQHWTPDQIADMFAPSQESVDLVSAWLAESGIDPSRIVVSDSRAWIDVNATVSEVKSLLRTDYHIYEHSSGHLHVASGSYSVPAYLSAEHVDLIMPTLHFDAKTTPGRKGSGDELRKRQQALRKRQVARKTRKRAGPYSDAARTVGGPNSGSLAKLGAQVAKTRLVTDLDNCDKQITPECLRALYDLPLRSTARPGNTYGIVEYTPQTYNAEDLDLFFSKFEPRAVGERPILESIDGGAVLQNVSEAYYAEPSLDLEYAMALVYPQKVTLYQVGDGVGRQASFNNFLDALDGAYCAYAGGNDPRKDAVYPNPDPAGYQGPAACGTSRAASVLSSSYVYNEGALTPAYQRRQCYEYMKLGLQGVTVLYASGDFGKKLLMLIFYSRRQDRLYFLFCFHFFFFLLFFSRSICFSSSIFVISFSFFDNNYSFFFLVTGVAGYNDRCMASNGTFIDGTTGRFVPQFPASCPYVTAVGATQVPAGTSILKDPAGKVQPEVACETIIRSSGGFSDVFPLPPYQSEAVTHYLTTYPPPFGADRYNDTGRARGFPDVAANGANYVIGLAGALRLVYGTSASAPTFGAVINLINERRLEAGKRPVGFLNPALYAHPDVLNDVVQGANPGCGAPGFGARPGWDPVTGLGTPNFPKMLELFLSLP